MKVLRRLTKLINGTISMVLLFVFYLAVIPVGKIIYLVSRAGVKKERNSYWREPVTKPVDTASPY